MNDLFGPGSNVEGRVFEDYENLKKKIEGCKTIGQTIVLTSGTFDLLHIGHCRYFENAKQSAAEKLGVDPNNIVLVIGIDGDDKVRQEKGPNRPIVPERERYEMLCHTRHVDLVMIKRSNDPHWNLIKTVRPHLLVVSERSKEKYGEKEIAELKKYCCEVVKLSPQAETSTSAKIRLLHVNIAVQFKERYQKFSSDVKKKLDEFSISIDEMSPEKGKEGA